MRSSVSEPSVSSAGDGGGHAVTHEEDGRLDVLPLCEVAASRMALYVESSPQAEPLMTNENLHCVPPSPGDVTPASGAGGAGGAHVAP
jgi:hypothetical protein